MIRETLTKKTETLHFQFQEDGGVLMRLVKVWKYCLIYNRLPVARLCAYFLEMHCLIIHEIVEIDVGLNETFLELQQLSFV